MPSPRTVVAAAPADSQVAVCEDDQKVKCADPRGMNLDAPKVATKGDQIQKPC